ncbi:MAG: RnfH family protein [Pseudomonadales bacterium]
MNTGVMGDAAHSLALVAVLATPERVIEVELRVPEGTTVGAAIRAASDLPPFAGIDLESMPVGIFGEPVARTRVVAAHDRIEFYLPLRIDPMEARRQRSLIK